jgi:parvulin-like peptidyl-prolyl isomerase
MTLRCQLATVLVLPFLACSAGSGDDPAVLSLGKQAVRRSEFRAHLRSIESQGGEVNQPDVRRALFDAYLEQRVLVLEARARGLTSEGASADDEERAVRRLLTDVALDSGQPSEDEVTRFYETHRAEFDQPEKVTVRQILVPSENEARDVRRRLARDPKGFEQLARTLSRAPDASAGGLMGTFTRGELPPELEAAVFTLAPGNATAIVPSPHGFHVLRVDERMEARGGSLDENREKIRAVLARQRWDKRVQDFMRALMAKAKVNYEKA